MGVLVQMEQEGQGLHHHPNNKLLEVLLHLQQVPLQLVEQGGFLPL
jgi:hypothetical protein